ncbi:hypothetical protein GCK32_000170 [Trichostrongylus colubriformis]|uniref:Uncharacterized protein n=1 Tax=Trichostrongylus colubriformis TaxID=6319 RepID=A0AAN8IML1_TRICO
MSKDVRRQAERKSSHSRTICFEAHREVRIGNSSGAVQIFYVDNVLLEGKDLNSLLDEEQKESKKLFSKIRMDLRDYVSNNSFANRRITEVDRATSTGVKVLGILCNYIQDTISLKCYEQQFVKTSKRAFVPQINGYCYDPLACYHRLDPCENLPSSFLQTVGTLFMLGYAPLSI